MKQGNSCEAKTTSQVNVFVFIALYFLYKKWVIEIVEKNAFLCDVFIEKAKRIHGDTYDYSLVNYKNAKTKILIICKRHGVFEQTPDRHINQKCGCPMCAGNLRSNTVSFIEKAKRVHGDLYDYSKVNYVNNKTLVEIICKSHGSFYQKPLNHLNGKGCKYCANNVSLTTEKFIENAKRVHGDEYDYSKTNYINNREPVTIVCRKHGEFKQIPYVHLNGNGCSKCGLNKCMSKRDRKSIYEKARNTFLERYKVSNPMYNSGIRSKHKQIVSSDAVKIKRIATKRKNNSFNTSVSERKLHDLLKSIFDENDIFLNYVSDEYPFKCDFYIKSRNLYIELNAHWTHGGRWYNAARDEDLIEKWMKGSAFYQNAVQTYTVRDVLKRSIAKDNNLNYIVFWKSDLSDAQLWIQKGCPDGCDWNKEYSWKTC